MLRPGGLTNTLGTGWVRLAASVPRGQISRDDVAAVIAGPVTDALGIGQTLELAGDIRSNTPLGSCGTAPTGRPLETRCQEPGTLITGLTKLLSVAAPAAKAGATSSSLSQSPLEGVRLGGGAVRSVTIAGACKPLRTGLFFEQADLAGVAHEVGSSPQAEFLL